MRTYFTLDQLIKMIEGCTGHICREILTDNAILFSEVQGSSNNHQAWKGGYADHVMECMNIAVMMYEGLSSTGRKLPFTLSDALLVLFLHDIEKPWKYDDKLQIKEELREKAAQRAFRDKKLKEYGIVLTEKQANAMEYVEGEIHNHSTKERYMGELAAFCHMCDIASARLWHDFPTDDDPWSNPRR